MLSVLDGIRPPRPVECPDWLWIIIERCWSENSASRLMASEVTALLAQPLSISPTPGTVLAVNDEVFENYLLEESSEPCKQDEGTSPPYTSTAKKRKNELSVSSIQAETLVNRKRRHIATFSSRDVDGLSSQETLATEANDGPIQAAERTVREQSEVSYTLENRCSRVLKL